MRKISGFALFILTLATVQITSCTKTCDNGYEGDRCNVPVNLKFAGIYAVYDTASINGATNVLNYSMTVTANNINPSTIYLKNFGGLASNDTLFGIANGGSFAIDSSSIGVNEIENTIGSLNGNTLIFTYTVIVSTDTVSRRAVGIK